MSIASASPSEIWNEETARQTPFILDRPGRKQKDQQQQQQHLFFTTSSTTRGDDQSSSTILKLHNPQTREVFERINVDDIIGVQLEIAMDLSNAFDDSDDKKQRRERDEKAHKGQEEMETLEQSMQQHLMEGKDKDKEDAQMPMMPSSSSSSSAYLHIYAYPQASPKRGLFQKLCTNNDESECTNNMSGTASHPPRHRHAHHLKIKLATNSNSNATGDFDFANARVLIQSIRQLANIDLKPHSKRYLVVVNPFSGTKLGRKVYDNTVKIMLEEAGIDHDVLITERAGHATDRMLEQNQSNNDDGTSVRDVSEYDAIIAIGGDGILAEVLHGLKKRSDYDALMRKINFGIIGCGSCNGLAASILHAKKEKYGRLESTFVICKGKWSNMDLSVYQTATNESLYTSFLTYTWGMISDIDIESEILRSLGEFRIDVWAIWRWINLRTYKGTFSYLPVPTNTFNKNDVGADDDANSNIENTKANIQPRMPQIKSDELPSGWITFEAEFLILWASHVTHAATKTMHSPDSTLDDGIFKVLIVRRPCSKFELLKILIGLETGSHVSSPKAEFIDCVAFRLDPISSGSFSNVDGEVVEPGRIQAYVQPSAIRFFS